MEDPATEEEPHEEVLTATTVEERGQRLLFVWLLIMVLLVISLVNNL